jgi:hypothetical protein
LLRSGSQVFLFLQLCKRQPRTYRALTPESQFQEGIEFAWTAERYMHGIPSDSSCRVHRLKHESLHRFRYLNACILARTTGRMYGTENSSSLYVAWSYLFRAVRDLNAFTNGMANLRNFSVVHERGQSRTFLPSHEIHLHITIFKTRAHGCVYNALFFVLNLQLWLTIFSHPLRLPGLPLPRFLLNTTTEIQILKVMCYIQQSSHSPGTPFCPSSTVDYKTMSGRLQRWWE